MSKLQLVSLAFLLTTSACQSPSVNVAGDQSTTPAGAVERDAPRKQFVALGTYELIGPPVRCVVTSPAFEGKAGALGDIENATGGDIIAVQVTLRAWDTDNDAPVAQGPRPTAASITLGQRTFRFEPTADGSRIRLDGFVLGARHTLELRLDNLQPAGASSVAFEVEPIFARAR